MKKNYILILLLTVTCFLKSNFTKAQVNVQDSLALVELYNSTDGPHWVNHTNWITTSPVASWYGIRLQNHRITYIGLSGNNLSGIIPASIGTLKELFTLYLSHNQLSGAIPDKISNLVNLNTLGLNHNKLTGTISEKFSKLRNLGILDLSHNKLNGSIPIALGSSKIYNLKLSNNSLTGNIPPELGSCKTLVVLGLDSNKLSGNIPPELGNLKNLRELYLYSNELNDTLPSELSKISKISFLDLSHNQFTGNIPASFGSFDGTVLINLSFNKLSGSIPSTLSNIINLRTLDLSHNSLTGNIPAAFSNFQRLEKLKINNNKLGGKLPSFLNDLKTLTTIILNANRYTFEGLGPLVQHNFNVFEYSPQKNIAIIKNKNSLFVSAGGKLTNNTYKWYRNGQLNVTITGDSTFQPVTSGDYNVEVTNSIATELTLNSDTVTYNVNKSFIASQSDDANIDQKISAISVYPNPAKTNTTLSFYATGKYTITLTDVSGKILQTKTGTAVKGKNNIQFAVSRYAQGMYLITIVNDKNQKQTGKLNKE